MLLQIFSQIGQAVWPEKLKKEVDGQCAMTIAYLECKFQIS